MLCRELRNKNDEGFSLFSLRNCMKMEIAKKNWKPNWNKCICEVIYKYN